MNTTVDYVVVGLGLAGMAFAEVLSENQKSFVVFENFSQTPSRIAGGVYNPVILKRFTPVWNADKQLQTSLPFYENLEQKLKSTFDTKLTIKRVFKSVEEQNDWVVASDNPLLSKYMKPKISTQKIDGITANYGFGELTRTGKIETKKLLVAYQGYLEKTQRIHLEKFEHNQIQFKKDYLGYKNIRAKKIVFCEGFGIKSNPFFSALPLQGTKGENLTVYAPKLDIRCIVKSSVVVLPLGGDYYKIEATFNRVDKTLTPTEAGKKELIEKLEKTLTVPYKIVKHVAGIRPTVSDRRPLVGIHPGYPQLAVLNGLGTRGVMIAPWVAKNLFHHLENGQPLNIKTDIKRFRNINLLN